jgi:hypothetical protein
MPKRVIDFDAMWGSDKLASCAEWAQAEYAWLYGLADASGCFEVTNLRVIWGRVAAIRRNLTIERLDHIFGEFQDKGLLFVWEYEGKRYGHWTGSDVPGRLPPPSWRMRLERLAPAVPKQQFAEYVSRFARGRASLLGGGFRIAADVEAERDSSQRRFDSSDLKSEIPHSKSQCSVVKSDVRAQAAPALNRCLEEDQAQDWNLNLNRDRKWDREKAGKGSPDRPGVNKKSDDSHDSGFEGAGFSSSGQTIPLSKQVPPLSEQGLASSAAAGAFPARDKSLLVARELNVGLGPSCGPVKVKPEALERMRARDGSRSP